MRSVHNAIEAQQRGAEIPNLSVTGAGKVGEKSLGALFSEMGVVVSKNEDGTLKLEWRSLAYAKMYRATHESPQLEAEPRPLTPLPSVMQEMYATRERGDMYFGNELVHSVILSSRSPVIRTMINSSFLEGREEKPKIAQDTDSVAAKQFVHFLYKGKFIQSSPQNSLPVELLISLLHVASMYDIPAMIDQIELGLLPLVSDSTFAELEKIGNTFNLSRLNEKCKFYSDSHPENLASQESI